MTQIKSYAMTSDWKTFQRAAAAHRNLRDTMTGKSKRDNAVDHATKWRDTHPPIALALYWRTTSMLTVEEDLSDTSADELTMEYTSAKRSRHAPLGAQRIIQLRPTRLQYLDTQDQAHNMCNLVSLVTSEGLAIQVLPK